VNLSLFWDINHMAAHTGWAHPVMAVFALWAGPVLLVIILASAWVGQRGRAEAARTTAATMLTGVAAVVALGLNQVAAAAHPEARPFVTQHGLTVLLKHAADNGFPSDHAVIAGALATGIVLCSWRWGVLAVLIALLLAFARVYVGVHYPNDVAVGLALGAVVAAAMVMGLTPMLARGLQYRLPGQIRRLMGVPAPTHSEQA
jgi:membrane-associated phospholipid phosphatase